MWISEHLIFIIHVHRLVYVANNYEWKISDWVFSHLIKGVEKCYSIISSKHYCYWLMYWECLFYGDRCLEFRKYKGSMCESRMAYSRISVDHLVCAVYIM